MPRGMSTGFPMAPTLRRRSCATTPTASAASSSISVLPTTYTVAANWENARAGFDNLFQACAAEPACNAAHPRLEETFTGLVNKLEAEPLTTIVSDPATGEDLEVMLDGGALVDWLRNQNYAVPLLQAAPNLIDGLAAKHAAFHRGDRQESGRAGHRHPVRMSLPSVMGWPLASAVAKTTRSRRRRISPRPGGKRFRTIPRRSEARASAAGRISTKTAATSGRSPPPRRPCAGPS